MYAGRTRSVNRPPPPPAVDLSDEDYELDSTDEDDSDVDVKPSAAPVSELARILGKKALKSPRHESLNMRQLYEMLCDGHVDLDPVYQRDIVWPVSRQEALIQSFFFNYYVPPVLFAIEWNDQDEEIRICIDGKQRCSTILAFMQGRVAFVAADKQRYLYTTPPEGKGRGKPLPPQLRRQFDLKVLITVEYENLTLEQQRDIFQRVQLGMALNGPEKLQAIAGDWSAWVTKLVKQFIMERSTLGELLPGIDLKRSAPFRALIMFVVRAYKSPDRAFPTQPTLASFLQRKDAPEASFRHKIELALAIFVRIAADYYETAFGTERARVAPIELDMIAYMIFERMGVMSFERLSDEISRMRATVRREIQDIRANTPTTKVLYDYVESLPRTKLPGEISAQEEYDDRQHARKRRREEAGDEKYIGHAVDGDESRKRSSRNGGDGFSAPAQRSPPPRYASPAESRHSNTARYDGQGSSGQREHLSGREQHSRPGHRGHHDVKPQPSW